METDEAPAFWFQPCEVWEIRGAAPGLGWDGGDGMGWGFVQMMFGEKVGEVDLG